MVWVPAVLPKGVDLLPSQSAATFVVPAPNGCNLNCTFCIIRERREVNINMPSLQINDYIQFLTDLVDEVELGMVCLIGHEPLLPESWTYTNAILKQSNSFGLPTTIVTNGTYLAERIRQLVSHNISGITVSLDSATPDFHDKIRRTTGTYKKVLEGLQKAALTPLKNHLMVASVLLPGKRYYLEDMPALLNKLGISDWTVSPLYKFPNNDTEGEIEYSQQIVHDMIHLQQIARKHDVEFLVDQDVNDFLYKKAKIKILDESQLHRTKRLEQILRLSPNGAFSIGRDIFQRVDSGTPTWHPEHEKASIFITKTFEDKKKFKAASGY